MELLGVVQFKVYCNSSFKNTSIYNKDGEKDFRFDLVLETNDSLFFIELKRLRPNAVKVFAPKEEIPIGFVNVNGQLKTDSGWLDSELSQQQGVLDDMQDVDILNLETHYQNSHHSIYLERDENGKYIKKSNKRLCETVKEVLQYATNQAVFYARLVRRDGGRISPKEDTKLEQLNQRLNKRLHIFGVVNISRSTFVFQEYQNGGQLVKDFQPFNY